MSAQGCAEPVPALLVYPTRIPSAQIGKVLTTIAEYLLNNLRGSLSAVETDA